MPASSFFPLTFLDTLSDRSSNHVSGIIDPPVVEPSMPTDKTLWEEYDHLLHSMLEEYMDESYFQPILDDVNLNKISSEFHTRQGFGPFTVVHYERSPELDLSTIKEAESTRCFPSDTTGSIIAVTEPAASMSVYEKLTGSRRTSPTAREKANDYLAMQQPSGCTWTHLHGPFYQSSTSSEDTPRSQQISHNSSGHATRVETADRISRIVFPAPSDSSSSLTSILSAPSCENLLWIPVVPCPENVRRAVQGIKDDWDFSEIRDFGRMDGAVRGRYREGMKGFLRVN
ncbi:MAG: hypothetical protein LQ337_000210 [Flavoplaca oasis]|nr:MAG: hypothetical protein LQ337_000210 [Flavoplaca oasis]